MTLLELVRQETVGSRRDIVVVAAISSAANAALLAIVNDAVQRDYSAGESLRTLLLFLIAFALYALCLRRTLYATATVLEDILLRVRLRLSEKIRETDLASLERLDQGGLFNALTSQTRVVSESAGILAAALQSAILLVFASLYLAWLSLPAFIFCLALLGTIVPLYVRRLRGAAGSMERTVVQEVHTVNAVRDLLDGFKEVKLSARRAADVLGEIARHARTLRALKLQTADLFNLTYIGAYAAFYTMMGAVMFVLPSLVTLAHADLVKVMMTVLFITGPLSVVINGVQALSKANVAVADVSRIEAHLDQAIGLVPAPLLAVSLPVHPERFGMEGVRFQYADQAGVPVFGVGPLDLTLRRGEILFLMGGNGSGKSTLIKLLTGLYQPHAGRLFVDGVTAGPAEMPAWRERFSAVFSDFHLFPRLYGVEAEADRVRALLRQFGLAGKTDFVDGAFTTLQLSTGQRKRLAMIVALLEDRPVYVFDEWAAEQDPEFRRHYYEELLPDLARRGKTVIAVTHDERYRRRADRVVTMELGQIEAVAEGGRSGSA